MSWPSKARSLTSIRVSVVKTAADALQQHRPVTARRVENKEFVFMIWGLIGICFLTLRGSRRIAFASGSFLAILRLRRRASSTFFLAFLAAVARVRLSGRSQPPEAGLAGENGPTAAPAGHSPPADRNLLLTLRGSISILRQQT